MFNTTEILTGQAGPKEPVTLSTAVCECNAAPLVSVAFVGSRCLILIRH